MVRPRDEMPTGAGGQDHMRASHADRERVIDALKAAFVQGRLTRAQLDTRVGQTLAARTHAELAAVTADVPAAPDIAQPIKPARPPSGNRAAKRAVKSGVGAITVIIVAVSTVTVAVGQPGAAVILTAFIVILAAVATAFVASVIAAIVALESRRQKRSGGQLPPRPASGPGGQASQHPVPTDQPGQLPPADPGQEPWSLTYRLCPELI